MIEKAETGAPARRSVRRCLTRPSVLNGVKPMIDDECFDDFDATELALETARKSGAE